MRRPLFPLKPLILTAIGIVGCCVILGVIGLLFFSSFLGENGRANKCTLPPTNFSEQDLVGTWWAGYESEPKHSDTLIIRDDGTYKQIIHLDVPMVDYESDWQSWWLEYHESGIPYLHLEGMSFCAMNPNFDCGHPTGKQYPYDFCEDRTIAVENEGVLIVIGYTQSAVPPFSGVNLWFPLGSENTWVYSIQEP